MTVDLIINYERDLLLDVIIKVKSVMKRMKLKAIFRIIDGMLTKSRFKDLFNKNVAAL